MPMNEVLHIESPDGKLTIEKINAIIDHIAEGRKVEVLEVQFSDGETRATIHLFVHTKIENNGNC